jgi:hypothetical protein
MKELNIVISMVFIQFLSLLWVPQYQVSLQKSFCNILKILKLNKLQRVTTLFSTTAMSTLF